LLTENNISFKYLPPYSPQLNPIEEAFAMLKNHYRRLKPKPKTSEEVMQAIEKIVYDSLVADFSGFYRHMRQHLNMAYNEMPFI
jgi:transposase